MSTNAPQPLAAGQAAQKPLPLASRFLSLLRYTDVYRHAAAAFDGNKKGSASDIEVRATLEELREVRHILSQHAGLVAVLQAVADEVRAYPESPRSYSGDSYLPRHLVEQVCAQITSATGGRST